MKKGFSLMEMLVALSLMAIMGAFVIPNIKKVQEKSYAMASEVNLRTFQSAIENYYIDNNTYPVGTLGVSDLFNVLKENEDMNTCPVNPYYKNNYTNQDVKGRITYTCSTGEDYSLTLFASDGKTTHLVLNKL